MHDQFTFCFPFILLSQEKRHQTISDKIVQALLSNGVHIGNNVVTLLIPAILGAITS